MKFTPNMLTVNLALILMVVGAACVPQPGAPGVTQEPTPAPIDLAGTAWVLSALRGQPPVPGTEITLSFESGNELAGMSGCNQYVSTYEIGAGGDLQIEEIVQTEIYCEQPQDVMRQESEYVEALRDIAAFRLEGDVLRLLDSAGEVVLTYRRDAGASVELDLQGTEWVLEMLDGEPPVPGSQITLTFQPEGIAGYAGCNQYGGALTLTDAGEVEVGELVRTERACLEPEGVMTQEDAYLAALAAAESYAREGERLHFENEKGETVLVFQQQPQLDMNPAQLVNTAWILAAMGSKPPLGETPITVAFKTAGELRGFAGCRRFTGTYQAEGDDLRVTSLSMVEEACDAGAEVFEQEGRFTTLLSETTDYRLTETELELYTMGGTTLTFEPLESTGPGDPDV